MRGRWIAGLMVAGALGLGCSSVRFAPEFASSAPYGRELAKHTRAVELYQGFDTVAKGWATWRSPALRAATAEARAGSYGLAEAAAAELRKEEVREGQGGREFHLALYAPKTDWSDLEGPRSLWRAFVELPGGERLEALAVTRLTKSDRAAVAYPYVTRWTKEFTLTFPLLDPREASVPPILVLAGPLGELRFSY